jgi:hypothetical protein
MHEPQLSPSIGATCEQSLTAIFKPSPKLVSDISNAAVYVEILLHFRLLWLNGWNAVIKQVMFIEGYSPAKECQTSQTVWVRCMN